MMNYGQEKGQNTRLRRSASFTISTITPTSIHIYQQSTPSTGHPPYGGTRSVTVRFTLRSEVPRLSSTFLQRSSN
jgi:hypothetical protein